MSERNFLRLFKREMGVTPSQYLLRARLNLSCELLVRSDLPIDKIARRVGLTNGERLSKVFRKQFSMSATEYRYRKKSGDTADPATAAWGLEAARRSSPREAISAQTPVTRQS